MGAERFALTSGASGATLRLLSKIQGLPAG